MSSGKRKNGADARAKKAALLFVACERNPDPTGRLSIPNVLRVKGYSEDETVNRTLQMQVRREVKKLKGNSSASAAATAMIMLSTTMTTITTTTSTATTISTISSESLDLPSPLKKMRKTSHQHQIYHQNKRKAKEAYAQALTRATTLIATERGKEKENACPTQSIITKVEGEFRARGFEVLLSKATVNRYVRNEMIGSAPLARGYEGIIPKAAFKLLVLAIEWYIQIKQLNCEVIVWKQLLVVVNKMCGIASIDRIKENMLDRVMRLTPVSFDAIIALPVEERRLLWTTYDNLHTWFMSFKEFCFKFEFATPNCNGDAVFLLEMLRRIGNLDETELSLDGSETQAGGRPAMSYRDPHLPMIILWEYCRRRAYSSPPSASMSAMLAELEKLWYDFCRHLKKTRGQFGHDDVRE